MIQPKRRTFANLRFYHRGRGACAPMLFDSCAESNLSEFGNGLTVGVDLSAMEAEFRNIDVDIAAALMDNTALYSTDVVEMKRLIDKLNDLGFIVTTAWAKESVCAMIYPPGGHESWSATEATGPLAVCVATLKLAKDRHLNRGDAPESSHDG